MAKTKRRQLAALAAQAAQAELKELAGTNERTSSAHMSGPSGTIPQAGDPNVEIRTQRVIFKIPALPRKPADNAQSLKIAAKKEVLGKRRRKIPHIDVDLSSEKVPEDGAKISKGISQSGKWKRQKKIRDLLPNEEQAVPPSTAELPHGDQALPLAKSTANEALQNGGSHPSVTGSERQQKKRVKFVIGSRKRAKLQEEVIKSPAEKDSKSIETQGKSVPDIGSKKLAKLQEVVIRSPAEKERKSMENQGKSNSSTGLQKRAKPQEVVAVRSPAKRERKFMEIQGKSKAISTGSRKRAKSREVVRRSPAAERESKPAESEGKSSKATRGLHKQAKPQEVVVTSSPPPGRERRLMGTRGKSKEAVESSALDNKGASPKQRRSSDLLVKDHNRSEDLAKASNGDLPPPSTLVHPPPPSSPWKRRRGNFQHKVTPPQVLPASPKATVISHHRTRSRAKDISYCEAMALEVLQEIQNVKKISQQQIENRGEIAAANGTLLVRGTADGEATYNSTRDQSQEQPQHGGNFTSPTIAHGKKNQQLARAEATADSLSHIVRSGPHASHHTCLHGDNAPGESKSRFPMVEQPFPVAHGEQQGIVPLQEKDLGKSPYRSTGHYCKNIVPGAEVIKRDSLLSIMEKRLKAAGGLGKWLLDNGLGQFWPVLEKGNIGDNMSLMQLTMEGLKRMGVLPVGPRRKLIHAISCLSAPSFTKASLGSAKPS